MWLVLTRAPLPDAPYWPGRRLLALVDAIGWPAAWIVLAMNLPQPLGVVGPVVAAVAVLAALGRVRRAGWENHRYRFTTWRWGRWAAAGLIVATVLKLALGAAAP